MECQQQRRKRFSMPLLLLSVVVVTGTTFLLATQLFPIPITMIPTTISKLEKLFPLGDNKNNKNNNDNNNNNNNKQILTELYRDAIKKAGHQYTWKEQGQQEGAGGGGGEENSNGAIIETTKEKMLHKQHQHFFDYSRRLQVLDGSLSSKKTPQSLIQIQCSSTSSGNEEKDKDNDNNNNNGKMDTASTNYHHHEKDLILPLVMVDSPLPSIYTRTNAPPAFHEYHVLREHQEKAHCNVSPIMITKSAVEQMAGLVSSLPAAETTTITTRTILQDVTTNSNDHRPNYDYQVWYMITPTVERPSQMVDLMRLMQTLQLLAYTTTTIGRSRSGHISNKNDNNNDIDSHIQKEKNSKNYGEKDNRSDDHVMGIIYWIVVEDADNPTFRIRTMLEEESGLAFAHVAQKSPTAAAAPKKTTKKKNNNIPPSTPTATQRNLGLEIVRRLGAPGIVFFAEEDMALNVKLLKKFLQKASSSSATTGTGSKNKKDVFIHVPPSVSGASISACRGVDFGVNAAATVKGKQRQQKKGKKPQRKPQRVSLSADADAATSMTFPPLSIGTFAFTTAVLLEKNPQFVSVDKQQQQHNNNTNASGGGGSGWAQEKFHFVEQLLSLSSSDEKDEEILSSNNNNNNKDWNNVDISFGSDSGSNGSGGGAAASDLKSCTTNWCGSINKEIMTWHTTTAGPNYGKVLDDEDFDMIVQLM